MENDTAYIRENSFGLKINRLERVSFSAVNVSSPGLTLSFDEQSSGYHKYKIPGTKIEYDTFLCRFIVDENLSNWKSVHQWFIDIVSSDDFKTEMSDFSVVIPHNSGNGGTAFRYINAFPISLESIEFSSLVPRPNIITAAMGLAYQEVAIDNA